MNSREQFFKHVRQAVAQGNRGGAAQLAERGSLGYQGAGPDMIGRFCDELKSAGGYPHVAEDHESAWRAVRGTIKSAHKIMLGRGGMIDRLALASRLRSEGLEVTTVDLVQRSSWRDGFFSADVGISNVEYLVAETGSAVVATAPDDPRSLSLLPPVHIAIAGRSQLLADLFDLFDLFSPLSSPAKLPPSCMTVITGPSKTGDIELRLVTGVHGPGEIHVVLCNW